MKKSEQKILTAIAIYQIFGGAVGIGIAIRIMPRLQEYSSANAGMVFIAILLYFFSIVCGLLLFKRNRWGITLSLFNQVLQVLSFAIGSYAYNYVAGVKIGFGIDFIPDWQLNVNLSLSSFQFFLGTETGRMFIGVNLLALFLVYMLERLKERVA